MINKIVKLVACILEFVVFCTCEIVFSDASASRKASFEIHTSNGKGPNIVVGIGVGTSMSVENYRKFAENLLAVIPNSIVVILDPNPSGRSLLKRILHPGVVKFHGQDYAKAFNNAASWIKLSLKGKKISRWYAGGHSASGVGTLLALSKGLLSQKLSCFIGLDPCCVFNFPDNFQLPISSIIWTTSDPPFNCVSSRIAGVGLHNLLIRSALKNRKVSKGVTHRLYRFIDGSKHCVFADCGCPMVGCKGSGNVSESHFKVAKSILDFERNRVSQFQSVIYTSFPS